MTPLFSKPPLAGKIPPERAYPPERRPITEAQRRRLYAVAMEAGHTKGSLQRLIRFYGFARLEDITAGSYDDITSIASDGPLVPTFTGKDPLPGERPFLKGTSEDEYRTRRLYAEMSLEDLTREAGFLTGRLRRITDYSLPPAITDAELRRLGSDLQPLIDELAWRGRERSPPD